MILLFANGSVFHCIKHFCSTDINQTGNIMRIKEAMIKGKTVLGTDVRGKTGLRKGRSCVRRHPALAGAGPRPEEQLSLSSSSSPHLLVSILEWRV